MTASSEKPFPKANSVPMIEKDRELVNKTVDTARQCLLANGRILPQAIMRNSSDEVFIVVSEPFDSHESKERFAIAMRITALEHRAVSLSYLSEAWGFDTAIEGADISALNKWREADPHRSLDEYPGPGVVEMIVIVFESHEGRGQYTAPIHRAADRTPYILDEELVETYFSLQQIRDFGQPVFGGLFSNLLPPKEVWENPLTLALAKRAREQMQGYMHDQDSELVREMREESEKEDTSIPRDLQN